MRILFANLKSISILSLLLGGLLLAGCAPGELFGARKSPTASDSAIAKSDASAKPDFAAKTDAPATADTSPKPDKTVKAEQAEKETPVKTAKVVKPKAAVDKDAGSYSQQMAKARTLEDGGRWDDARTIYEKLAIDAPNRYEAYHRLGVVADHRKHYADAQNYYAKALKLQPNDPEILNDLGYCYLLQGQLNKAETALAKAVKLAPDNPRYCNNLGLIHGHQGKTDIALNDFRKSGSEAEAQYNLAFVFAAKNDMDGAKNCFKQALVADPSFDPARKALHSFERIEADPTILADYEENPSDGVRLVPYIEPDASNTPVSDGKAPHAPATSNSPGANTRALQSQARSMMQDRLSATQER